MKIRNLFVIVFLPLLAVSCSTPFSTGSKVGGLYKTTNSGADWVTVNKTITETPTGKNGKIETKIAEELSSADIRQLAWSEKGPKRLFTAAGKKGLFVSEDDGGSWKNLLSSITVDTVGLDPQDSQRIVVGGNSNTFGRILFTLDAGKTWNEAYAESQAGTVQSLSIHPNGQWIAAGMSNGGVLLSRDKGVTWSLAYNLDRNIVQVLWQENDLYILQASDGLFVARGGVGLPIDVTQSIKSINPVNNEVRIQATAPAVKPNEFWQVDFSKVSPNLVYLATDVGVFSSNNSGASWRFLSLPVKDVGNQSSARAVVAGLEAGKIIVAVEGNIYLTKNDGQSWEVKSVAQGGRIRYILLDRLQPKTMFVGAERIR